MAERRLRHVSLIGRARQIALLVDGDEIPKLARSMDLRSKMTNTLSTEIFFRWRVKASVGPKGLSGALTRALTGTEKAMTGAGLPLDGVRVVEMTHMVMGPTCGMILAQLGAEGSGRAAGRDKTRSLGGMGTSFFPLFNRGKRSVVLDFARPETARP